MAQERPRIHVEDVIEWARATGIADELTGGNASHAEAEYAHRLISQQRVDLVRSAYLTELTMRAQEIQERLTQASEDLTLIAQLGWLSGKDVVSKFSVGLKHESTHGYNSMPEAQLSLYGVRASSLDRSSVSDRRQIGTLDGQLLLLLPELRASTPMRLAKLRNAIVRGDVFATNYFDFRPGDYVYFKGTEEGITDPYQIFGDPPGVGRKTVDDIARILRATGLKQQAEADAEVALAEQQD